MKLHFTAPLMLLFSTAAIADAPTIQSAAAEHRGENWTFTVTLTHPDTGWDHYADGWQILAPDGTPLGTRNLAHPHVNEQPFTRSLGFVKIAADTPYVTLRARDNVSGWYPDQFRVKLEN